MRKSQHTEITAAT